MTEQETKKILHKINSPLTAVIGYVYMLERKLSKNDTESQEILLKIKQTIENITKLIADLQK